MEELRRWLFLLRIPLVLLGVVLFFVFYNRLLIDRSLQNLKTSLSILDKATGVGQAEAALLLVDQTLTAQMAREELDLQAIATLQYTQGILSSDKKQRPVEDTQAMLSVMEEEQDLERPGFLKSVDAVILGTQAIFGRASLLPRQVLAKAASPEIDQAGLQEAARLERRGLNAEAALLYERLIQRYPHYEGRVTLHFRLGSLYERTQNSPGASKQYKEAQRLTKNLAELTVARQSQTRLETVQAKQSQAADLEKKLSRTSPGPQRQQSAMELGALWIELSDMNRAAAAFHQAEGPTSLFKEAWCLRSAGRLEEALQKFLELARHEPKGPWAAASYQQIAEIYKITGNYDGAAQIYEQAIAQGDDPTAAILHAQAAATYLYDLKNPEKAYLHFHDLEVRYPASPFSALLKQIQDLHKEKQPQGEPLSILPGPGERSTPAALPPVENAGGGAFAEGSPLMGWMEKFLPVFVDVFTGRLEKFMVSTNQTKLKRQFTEIEFRDLVVREVQRRFPGQVTEIDAKIRPEGFLSSGTVRLGLLSVPIQARIGIEVVKERPHVILQEIKVTKIPLPKPILKMLESRVNSSIDNVKYPLKVKEYTLKEGYAIISVELAR